MAGNDRSFAQLAGTVNATPAPQDAPGALAILHLDAACIVVDKPAGRLSVPGRGPLAEGSVAQHLQAVHADAMVVHRLDMATSGVLLFARGAHWQRRFNMMFAQRMVEKRYVALVEGRLGAAIGASGEIDLPLSADWPNRPRQRVDQTGGKPSLTRWRTIDIDPGGAWTRLELTPVTGRSHQLRVHLQSIGHPIVGDALYGASTGNPVGRRLMLHACAIGLQHPLDGRWLGVESSAPF